MAHRPPNHRAVTPQNRGRFEDFDVLRQVDTWDDVTAGVVLARLSLATDLAFFTMAENAIVGALVDHLLGQDCEPKVPVVALIDSRLALGETDGWRYDELPEDGQAWRDTLRHLDDDAKAQHDVGFAALDVAAQLALIQAVQDAATDGKDWHDIPAKHVWSLWTRYCCAAFYSHPWAWNEIGFSGPAYPRGYKNVGIDARERWEVADSINQDPVPFATRVEHARHDHESRLGHRPTEDGGSR